MVVAVAGMRFSLVTFAMFVAVLVPAVVQAKYRLQPGDEVTISVASLPALAHTSMVGVDGDITVPLVGQMQAEGRTLEELNEALSAELSQQVFRQTSEGVETVVAIEPGEIVVSISQYRPVYVRGAVRLSGEQPFRPGLTVRQVLAVAGGVDPLHDQSGDPFAKAIELRSNYEALFATATQFEARRRRIQAELEGQDSLDLPADGESDGVRDLAMRTEAERMKAGIAALEHEKAYLRQAIEQAEQRAEVLEHQQAAEEEGRLADTAELERITALFDRGLTPMSEIIEARKRLLLSSTRSLETSSELAEVQTDAMKLRRDLQATDENRQLELLDELAEVNGSAAEAQPKLKGIAELLLYTGALQDETLDRMNAQIQLTIFRNGGGSSPEQVNATEETMLLPGDVVEVDLRFLSRTEAPGN